MPSRVVRSEINASESMARVSECAELMFRALILAVDDFGRLDARPKILKAELFPMRDAMTTERIDSLLAELVAEGCVRLYETDGRRYLELTGWERHRANGKRAKRSKFPEPPGQSDGIRGDPRKSEDPLGIHPSDDARGTTLDARRSWDDGRGTNGPPAAPAAADAADPPPLEPGRRLAAAWEAAQKAFEAYGKRPRELPEARRKLLRARLREYPDRATVLADAVHGYMAFHARAGGDFDPLGHLTPETVFRPSNVAKYLEAYDRAVEAGRVPPFAIEPRASPRSASQERYERTIEAGLKALELIR